MQQSERIPVPDGLLRKPRFVTGPFVASGSDRIDRRIEFLNTGDAGFEQLYGGEMPTRDQRSHLDCGKVDNIIHGVRLSAESLNGIVSAVFKPDERHQSD